MARRPSALDWGLAAIGVVLAAIAVWAAHNPFGAAVAGPAWLTALFPLALGLPLAWRRVRPLGCCAVVTGALVVQAVVTSDSPEGLEVLFCVGIAAYSVAAYSPRARALAGLGVLVAGYAIYAGENHDVRSGQTGELWAGAFFAAALLATWLVGTWMRGRREEAVLARRAGEAEREAAQAVTEERARMARELHDIVSHNLSVVVLQAAGARASGGEASTLEKIEHSGRQALVEMRRLLGVLREDGDDASLEPQPGISQVAALVARMGEAGLPVELSVEGDLEGLSPAVELSVYRIVQEALTNTLRHAGPARARVLIRRADDALTVEVLDDGAGAADPSPGGHGLVGMRERVAIFGGELDAGSRPEGGFAVRARLPLVREST